MEAQLFQQLKAVDDAASTATAADLRATQFHGINTIAFEADVADGDGFTRQFFLGRSLNDGGTSAATKQQTGGVTFGITTDQQHFFTLLRHHVTEVGQREALANATLAINGNDLRFFGDFLRADSLSRQSRLLAQTIHKLNRLFV